MSDNLILDFPVLKNDTDDFKKGISYEVEAEQTAKKLTVRHTVQGQSFIRQLMENSVANFSVLLFYRDGAERQYHACNTKEVSITDDKITATQTMPIDFSYAPEITPSIFILEDQKITINDSSGLTDFWENGSQFFLSKYSRIALGQKLKFTSGDISKLMKVEIDEKLNDGEMRIVVYENAGEGETPVTLLCGKGVYDELRKVTRAEPSNAIESMRSAIITQALCAVYAYMQNLGEDYEPSGVLAAHLGILEGKTGENWANDNFNPSLAATKMQPYVISAFRNETDDDRI